MLRPLLLLLLWFIPSAVSAQTDQQYIFHHLGVQDGLLASETRAIVQDSKGFIWIAGKNGLQRFDGNRFLNFRHREGDPLSLPHNNIVRLCLDAKDRLWLITSDFHLGYFDVHSYRFHEVKISFRNKQLARTEGDLYVDEKNNILLVLNRSGEEAWGVVTYDENRDIFTTGDKRFEVPADWHITFLSIDSLHKNYWYATSKGLIKYNRVTGNFNYREHNPDNDPVINALQHFTETGHPLLDKNGNFWMTTFQDHQTVRLIYYDHQKNTVSDRTNELANVVKKYTEIRNICLGSEGSVWFSGLNILARVDDKNKFEVAHSNPPGEFSIRFDDLYTFYKDREKNIWLTSDKGVYWFNPFATLFHTVHNRRPNSDIRYTPDVTDIKQLMNGNIIVSTWGSGIFEYDKNFEPVNSPLVEQSLQKGEGMTWSVLQRRNGDVWRANQDGWLFIYHPKSNTTEKLQVPVFNKKTIRQIAEDRNGNLWLGTQGGAIVRWTASTNTFALMKKMDGLVKRLYADKNGNVWVIAGKVEEINIDDGTAMQEYNVGGADGTHLPSADLSDIVQYNDSIYAIGGEQLSILNTHTKRFSYFNTSTGLPSDYISNLTVSKSGDLWIATENGIYAMNLLNGRNSSYGSEDGITNSHFNYAASCVLSDGRIVFGTNHEFVVFNPSELNSRNFTPPGVEITAVKLFNKRLSVDSLLHLDKINLSYTENSLSFQFSTLIYPSKHAIAYKMEGVDKEWITGSSATEAVYSYLPPGNFTLQVGSPDAEGEIRNIRSLSFHISAPFWKTWTFYLSLFAIVTVVAWYFYKARMKGMKDVLLMRNTIGKDLHKEVRTTLKNISVLSEIAAMKADQNVEQSKDYIQEIKQKSRNTVIAMDDVMWSIDPANDSMTKTMERINEIAEILHNEYDTHVEIEIENKMDHHKMSMKQRLEFIMIYKRAMLMLCRDLRAKTVHITLELKKKDLLLQIFAPGIQLLKNDKKTDADVAEIKNRAASINSMADVQSDAKGTAFIALIKKDSK